VSGIFSLELKGLHTLQWR